MGFPNFGSFVISCSEYRDFGSESKAECCESTLDHQNRSNDYFISVNQYGSDKNVGSNIETFEEDREPMYLANKNTINNLAPSHLNSTRTSANMECPVREETTGKSTSTESVLEVNGDATVDCDSNIAKTKNKKRTSARKKRKNFTAQLHQSQPISTCEKCEQLESELERLKIEYTCRVCMDSKVQVIFWPCKHFVCCTDCGPALRHCPVCRARVEAELAVFTS